MHTVKYRGTPQFGADGEEYVDYLPGEVRYIQYLNSPVN